MVVVVVVSHLHANISEILAFVGDKWKHSGDVKVSKLVESAVEMDESISPERISECLEALDIDINWRYHMCSQGEQRRIQLLMALLRPFKVLLLDEVTVDLDVAVRFNFLSWLKRQCEQTNASVVLATHVYDGIDAWATHVMSVAFTLLSCLALFSLLFSHTHARAHTHTHKC